MNRRQKLVQQRFLNNEEEVIKELKKTYTNALDDINNNIKNLNLEINSIQGAIDVWEDFGGDEEKAILQSQLQSKIYQKQYQEALHGQIDDVLDKMNTKQFNTVSGYLKTCYDDGYIGTLYDLQGQGVPLIMPIDQEAVVRAVQLDSKISQGLYNRMGEDVTGLKKVIASEVSRGIATGMTYEQVARQITHKMVGTGYKDGGAMASAMRIARTEGHRIQCQAGMDACYRAKDMGADVVKKWSAVLDAKTRDLHQKVDGEIRELDDKFSNGLMFPGDPSGKAAEVVNCRCALLQKARWILEGSFTKMNNFTKEIEFFDSPKEYDEFKKAFWSKENKDFMNYHTTLEERYGTKNFEKLLGNMTDDEYKHWQKLYNNSPVYNKAVKSNNLTSKSEKIEMRQYDMQAKPPAEYDGMFDDFAELDLSKEEAETLSVLWSASKESGCEYGAVIGNGVISKPVTSNLPNAVKISLDDYENGLTVLHSHTNATSPSATDFQWLLDPKVDKIGVVGYNADVYMAYIGDGEVPSLEDFKMTSAVIGNTVNQEIIDHPNFFDWTFEERNYMAIREQSFRIAQHYGWTLEGGRIDVE